jgi:FkbM family methyltransferase
LSKDVAVEILKYLNFNDGVFLEVGANDGVFQSNSLALEKNQNWSGILIEASPYAYNQCLANRDNEKNIIIFGALVSDEYKEKTIVGDFNGHPMGSIGGKRLNNQANANIEVPAYTLTEVLSYFEIEKVDAMFIDVEGEELGVLHGLDFDTWSPKFFLIEWNKGEDELFPFMESKGYECVGNISDFNLVDDKNWPQNHQDFGFRLNNK